MKAAKAIRSVPTCASVMAELKKKATEQTRATYIRHGLPADRMFGVSAADVKSIAKTIRGQQALACELFETGNTDAMYLAGTVADGSQMTRKQLNDWAEASAGVPTVSEFTVPGLAVQNPLARELAMEWIASKKEHVASCGWCTYSGIVAVQPDEALNLAEIQKLLRTIAKDITGSANRVRYTMNSFVISVGTYVKPLLAEAKRVAKEIGVVYVDMGNTACKVPLATAYIEKVESLSRVGQKRKALL
jgi:3-methyladenine DNA glycosylase AlkD